jgi:hypothetical protein
LGQVSMNVRYTLPLSLKVTLPQLHHASIPTACQDCPRDIPQTSKYLIGIGRRRCRRRPSSQHLRGFQFDGSIVIHLVSRQLVHSYFSSMCGSDPMKTPSYIGCPCYIQNSSRHFWDCNDGLPLLTPSIHNEVRASNDESGKSQCSSAPRQTRDTERPGVTRKGL